MITYLHLVVHFLIMLISLSSLVIPFIIKNKLEVTKIQNDLNQLKQIISKLDQGKM